MRGAMPPLANTPTWRGDPLKKGRDFTFTFNINEREHYRCRYV